MKLRMGRWTVLALALIGLAGMMGLAGCGGGGGNGDESRIRGRYGELARALDRERVDDFMTVFSPDYYDNGANYTDVRNAVAELFDQYNNINASYSIRRVDVTGNTAIVDGTEYITGNDVFQPGAPLEQSVTDFTDVWRYEHGDWFLYGNQQGAGVQAHKTLPRWHPDRVRAATK